MPEEVKQDVNPAYEIEFGICLTGRPKDEEMESAEYTDVKDAEGITISIDGKVEEWSPMHMKGWTSRRMTGKSLSMSMGGKRNYGDPGNDYVAGLMLKTGLECNNTMRIVFPNGDKLYIPCVINVTSAGGEATALDGLEWEVLSDGKPKYVKYTAV